MHFYRDIFNVAMLEYPDVSWLNTILEIKCKSVCTFAPF